MIQEVQQMPECPKHHIAYTLVEAERGKTLEMCLECERQQRDKVAKMFPTVVSIDQLPACLRLASEMAHNQRWLDGFH